MNGLNSFTEWETPKLFYDTLNTEFNFTCDVCANPYNTKHENYYSLEDNGLLQEWTGVCWMNPPYDRSIGLWMEKAWESSQQGATVVCLIQGRSSDTIWWHDYVMKSSEIRYIKDRIHFGKHGVFTRSNISNILVIFTPFCTGYPTTSSIDRYGCNLS